MTSPQLWPNCCRVFETDTLRNAHCDRASNVPILALFFPFFFYHPLCRPAGIDRGSLWYWILETQNAAETIAPAAVRSISREYRVAGSKSSRLPDRELLSATDVFSTLSSWNFFPPSPPLPWCKSRWLTDDCAMFHRARMSFEMSRLNRRCAVSFAIATPYHFA